MAMRPTGGTPALSRPLNLARAYEIPQVAARARGAVGGWWLCDAEPEALLACAPLPLSTMRPGLSRVSASEPVPLPLALCLWLGHGLPDYNGPFSAEEVAAAIATSHVGLLILRPQGPGGRSADVPAVVATRCRQAEFVCGLGVPGLVDAGTTTLEVVAGRGSRYRDSLAGTVAVSDAIAVLAALANAWAHWAGGLAIGPTVAFGLPGDEIEAAPGMWVQVSLGMLGIFEVRVESSRA